MRLAAALLGALVLLPACEQRSCSSAPPVSEAPAAQRPKPQKTGRVTAFADVTPAPTTVRFEMNSVKREYYEIDLDLKAWTLAGKMRMDGAEHTVAKPTALTPEQKRSVSAALSHTRLVVDSKAVCDKRLADAKANPIAICGSDRSFEVADGIYSDVEGSCARLEADEKHNVHAVVARAFVALASK